MNNPWSSLPPSVKNAVLVGGGLLLLLLLYMWGARAVNWTSRKIFNGKNVVITGQIQADLDAARGSKEVAEDAIKELAVKNRELADAKEAHAEEKHKRELAEGLLADKSKNTDQKIKAYQDALSAAPTVHVEPEPLDEQCARAKALGLQLEACK